ncbi:MAG TPA: TonB-dependent receptor [Longimicrobiales bacterium]|nr:TonB-dependent receptor [Longimicrobiales bacterium]
MRSTVRGAVSAAALLLTVVTPAVAQNGAVAGIVRASVGDAAFSASRTPLATVQVRVLGPGDQVVASTLTTSEGSFRIGDVPPGTYTVVFTSAGWVEHREPGVQVVSGQTTSLQIAMGEQVFNLNPITVTASKTEEKVLEAPAAVEVVGTQDIAEQPATTIAEHLKDVPGVDVLPTGLQGAYLVVRGFNNIFSGATLTMTDNRIARVPSLRANILHFNPTTNLDLERIEVVLGPGSALYGPNASSGVVHSITKSPIDYPGGILSFGGGFRQQGDVPGVSPIGGFESSTEPVYHGEGRYAWRHSDRLGAKLSGQFFNGEDYRFVDPGEAEAQARAQACVDANYAISVPACRSFDAGLDLGTLDGLTALRTSVDNVAGGRDYDLKRWALDGRVDWRPNEETSLIFAGGRSMTNNSIDLTGLGAGQVQNWAYGYGQVRALWKTAFAQVFFNKSDNDETYLLQSGRPLIDRSSLLVAQIQNSTAFGRRQNFVYGFDFLRTNPQTERTINGRNEDDDQIKEFGGYVQSETDIGSRLDLVAALRVDKSDALEDPVFSPRAALVYSPDEANSLRVTFNRSFSTPSTLNLYLDISGASIPLGGPFRYDFRAQGVTNDGLQFQRRDGVALPDHMTPFGLLIGSNARTFQPTTTGQLWATVIEVVRASNPMLAGQLESLPPPSETDVGVSVLTLNRATRSFEPTVGIADGLEDVAPLKPTITNTLEAGYKGLLADRLLLAANVYYSKIDDFISALRNVTPNVFLNAADLIAYLTPFVGAANAQAIVLADENTTGIGEIPLGVITATEAGGTDATLILTYRNLADFDLWGSDLSATFILTDQFELSGSLSFVSDDRFDTGEEEVALNATTSKGSIGLRYRNEDAGFNANLRGRAVKGFPFNSAIYEGRVNGYALADLNVGYRIPGAQDVWLTVDVQNLLDRDYRPTVGGPRLGRFTTLRLRYAF